MHVQGPHMEPLIALCVLCAAHAKPQPQPTNKQLRAEKQLRKQCLILNKIQGDGNCLFRAISDQLTGDET